MAKIRVLTVDDSVVIRRLLSDILSADPDIEVAGYASNGRLALAKIPQLNPDLITLDIEMPELDGLETLTELRKTYPKLPVIMFSTLTERGAEATLEALSRGATDYVAKPANVGSVSAGMQSVREQLIPKIKALCPGLLPKPVTYPSKSSVTTTFARPAARKPQRCDVVVIGSSTGGPQALTSVLKQLPRDFPVPIIVVQHMPPVFTRNLAMRLDQECAVSVVEAAGGESLEPGHVLIAPGDFHLEIHRQGLAVKTILQQGPPENSCRPAVDVMFRSAAKVYGSGCLGVVLTGMGQDGLRGTQSIVDAGGSVLAQDEESSVVWGMPRAVAEAGLTTAVLPLSSIPHELVRLTMLCRHQVVAC
jgi:two-component system, chemotaxis family, protein-glutamate methylesterase/glutaminase